MIAATSWARGHGDRGHAPRQLSSVKAWVRQMMPAALNTVCRDFALLSRARRVANSPPLTAAGLRGRVVLIDFCTYTASTGSARCLCPGVGAKYEDQGLVVIGVHTPEFPLRRRRERSPRVKDMKMDYPIAIDNDYAIWRGFQQPVWPASISSMGGGTCDIITSAREIRQSERMIQQLLAEAGVGRRRSRAGCGRARGIEAAAIGTACSLGRIMSATTVPRTSRLPVGRHRTRARVYAVPNPD